MAAFPSPVGGASLLLSFRLQARTVLIVGSNSLAASRAFSALEADSSVVVIAKGGEASACEELKWRAQRGQLTLLDIASIPCSSVKSQGDTDAAALDGYLSSSPGVAFVVVTDTILGDGSQGFRRGSESAAQIAHVCRSRNIPVNVTDAPALCDFSFTSTHRFVDPENNQPSPLQIGVTTNGKGCRLSGRIRRDVVTRLPKEIGGAVQKVGQLRELAKASSTESEAVAENVDVAEESEESVTTPNKPVPQRSRATQETETSVESARRRMKWVAQVSEYWPIARLAKMSLEEMDNVLDGQSGLSTGSGRNKPDGMQSHPGDSEVSSLHSLSLSPETCGRILLVGSGPGHPSLLTVATHNALTKHADVVLSDKLVPAAVLAIIPPHVEVRIARKFPGNADGAQNELMEAAIEAAKKGKTVVRLKQGDPSVYGRAGEEVLYFRSHGYEPTVIPGVSSVLAGPTFAGIPVTQRGAAESFVVCTGVGRQGKEVQLPGYERSRTLVLLMGVARLPQILDTLLSEAVERRAGAAYPANTPIALIERASMPDQRVIFSTLSSIAQALESVGEQRPPGMLVIGWSVLSLWDTGDVSILEDGAETKDGERIAKWLDGQGWRITEGLEAEWERM
ncbi:uroporphyrin-III C-methyltransferase [Trametopsis cervina]|nr:uroporphyrin-III C-methyltransferase [Trametopsis cervina]